MRSWLTVFCATVLVGALLSSAPALAQPGATGGTVPEAPNIVDAATDANHHSFATGQGGGSLNGADILAVWFSTDADNLYVHIQTTNGARLESLTFITYVGPAPETDCIQLRMTTAGQGVEAFSSMDLSGDCGDETTPFGPLLEEEGPDGTAILTGAFPRSAHAAFADGQTLHEPDALVGHNLRDVTARALIIDDTEVGTNYEVKTGGSEASPPPEEPPGKSDPPGKGKKKGCKKGKGKKKGACAKPQPEPQACAAYTPGEQGAEAATTVVTDAATTDAPIEVPIATEAGVPEEGITHSFHNIQVDSSAASTGLYARFEFDYGQDYDIFLYNAAGEEQAQAAGANQALVIPGEPYGQDNDEGGHSETDAEALDGVTTADCGGYTMDIASYFSEGGEYTLKLWLGEAVYAPGGGELQDAALALF